MGNPWSGSRPQSPEEAYMAQMSAQAPGGAPMGDPAPAVIPAPSAPAPDMGASTSGTVEPPMKTSGSAFHREVIRRLLKMRNPSPEQIQSIYGQVENDMGPVDPTPFVDPGNPGGKTMVVTRKKPKGQKVLP